MYKYFGDILSEQFENDGLKDDNGEKIKANKNPDQISLNKEKKISDFLKRRRSWK